MQLIIWQSVFHPPIMSAIFFGPSSLETEDNILRLDRVLAELFQYVDKKIGLDKTLIVLSGDHGAPEALNIWLSTEWRQVVFHWTGLKKALL